MADLDQSLTSLQRQVKKTSDFIDSLRADNKQMRRLLKDALLAIDRNYDGEVLELMAEIRAVIGD